MAEGEAALAQLPAKLSDGGEAWLLVLRLRKCLLATGWPRASICRMIYKPTSAGTALVRPCEERPLGRGYHRLGGLQVRPGVSPFITPIASSWQQRESEHVRAEIGKLRLRVGPGPQQVSMEGVCPGLRLCTWVLRESQRDADTAVFESPDR